MLPPVVIGRRAVDQVVVGSAKEAGYYLIDMSRCGKNINLGTDRWRSKMSGKQSEDSEWNVPYFTSRYTHYLDMASAADYVVTRYGTYSKLYMGRNKHGLKKLINKPYYVLTPFPQNTSTVFNSSYSRRNVTIKKPWRLLRSRRFRESFNYVI